MTYVIEPARRWDLPGVRRLLREYAKTIPGCHCLCGFDREVAGLPGLYAEPAGRLLVARRGRTLAGCVGVRPLKGRACELKRLYVRPAHRGAGLGRLLTELALAEAKDAGYRRIVLDTLPSMKEARALYRSLGFERCRPYGPLPARRPRQWSIGCGRGRLRKRPVPGLPHRSSLAPPHSGPLSAARRAVCLSRVL